MTSIVLLAAFKWQDLSLPYFWDELGVYSQAADYQYHHALSLQPASVPPVLSRGHPLMFTFIIASAMRVSGEHIFAIHLFCLAISVLLLVAVYLKVSRYFGPLAGLLSALILAMQPVFLAQCGMVLPEICLSLCTFLALCSYYENRFLRFAVYASLAILTKESAIILPGCVMFFYFCRCVWRRELPSAYVTAIICLPYIVYGIFLLRQKQQNGWYFFPYHLDAVSLKASDIFDQFRTYLFFLFKWQGRYIISIVCVVALLFSIGSKRSQHRRLLYMISFTGLVFLCFHSLFSVYLARYILMVLVLASVLAGVSLASIPGRNWLCAAAILTFLFISHRHWEEKDFRYDADLGYRRGVQVVKEAVGFTMGMIKPGDKVFANFPAYYAFSFPEAGYWQGRKLAKSRFDDHGDHYMLLCDPGAAYEYDHDKYHMSLIRKFQNGPQHVDLYYVKETRPEPSPLN